MIRLPLLSALNVAAVLSCLGGCAALSPLILKPAALIHSCLLSSERFSRHPPNRDATIGCFGSDPRTDSEEVLLAEINAAVEAAITVMRAKGLGFVL